MHFLVKPCPSRDDACTQPDNLIISTIPMLTCFRTHTLMTRNINGDVLCVSLMKRPALSNLCLLRRLCNNPHLLRELSMLLSRIYIGPHATLFASMLQCIPNTKLIWCPVRFLCHHRPCLKHIIVCESHNGDVRVCILRSNSACPGVLWTIRAVLRARSRMH